MISADSGQASCSICGCCADASWVGEVEVHVCRSCAIDVLPRLMADAIYGAYRCKGWSLRPVDVEDALIRVQLYMWRALANQAFRDAKPMDDKPTMRERERSNTQAFIDSFNVPETDKT